jgi:uncharacterized protein (TIGR04255 family)
MPETPTRPAHLPDYRNPPLNEVVLGVQFAPAQGYQQIRAGEVWNLYKPDFPHVEEMPPIPPAFETFGLLPSGRMFNFGVVTGAQHDRFWFLSEKKDDLIQFQQDRLLHNWRKVGDQSNEYPRFEKMILKFAAEARRLEAYFQTLAPQDLVCNQAEISYINHIAIDQSGDRSSASDWFRFLKFNQKAPDEVSAQFRRAIMGPSDVPIGRLNCEMSTAVNTLGSKMFVLNLTVRGAPSDTTIGAALDFLKQGREIIVEEFAAITTDSAQDVWGRVR